MKHKIPKGAGAERSRSWGAAEGVIFILLMKLLANIMCVTLLMKLLANIMCVTLSAELFANIIRVTLLAKVNGEQNSKTR